jgi:hypothetical protein
MSNLSVDRVREDLAVMQHAIATRPPYGPKQVRESLIVAAIGAAIAAITALTPIARLPARAGSLPTTLYGLLIAAPILLLFFAGAARSFGTREKQPLDWRDSRRSLIAFVLSLPLFFAPLRWTSKHGESATTYINAFVIFAGMFWLLGAVSDERYRHYWGWGLATILFGLVMPLGSYSTAGIFAGCWILLGSLSTAAIMAWHLRKEPAHGGD